MKDLTDVLVPSLRGRMRYESSVDDVPLVFPIRNRFSCLRCDWKLETEIPTEGDFDAGERAADADWAEVEEHLETHRTAPPYSELLARRVTELPGLPGVVHPCSRCGADCLLSPSGAARQREGSVVVCTVCLPLSAALDLSSGYMPVPAAQDLGELQADLDAIFDENGKD